MAKVQTESVAYLLLIFCQFQPGIVYESVAYIKKRVLTFLKFVAKY